MSVAPPIQHVANFVAATSVGIPDLAVVTEAQKQLGTSTSLGLIDLGVTATQNKKRENTTSNGGTTGGQNGTQETSSDDPNKKLSGPAKIKISLFTIATLIIGALLFIAIIAWFDFLHLLYDETFIQDPTSTKPFRYYGTVLRLGYALLVTGISGLISIIVWHYFI